MGSKRWSRTEFRDELKTRFGHLLSDDEGISLREARRDIDGLTRAQLDEIYESAKDRLTGVNEDDSDIGFGNVVEEVKVQDLLPALAANARAARSR